MEPDNIIGHPRISECENTTDAYKLLVTTFINLQTILKQNLTSSHKETVIKAIDVYQSSLFGYKTVSHLYSKCYWFEPNLWWRKGPKPKCLPDELQTKTDEVVLSAEFKAFTDHIKGAIISDLDHLSGHLPCEYFATPETGFHASIRWYK